MASKARRLPPIKEAHKDIKRAMKCSRCPEDHPATLHFHHRDPSKKFKGISLMVCNGWSLPKILEEMEKCDILCANCHLKEHHASRF